MFCCLFAREGLPCDCRSDVLDTITSENAQNYEAFWNIVSVSYNEEEYAAMIRHAKQVIEMYDGMIDS